MEMLDDDGSRQGRPGEHLSAACEHIGLFFSSLMPQRSPMAPTSLDLRTSFKNQASRAGILLPTGPRRETWDLLVMVLILYSAASVPVRVCFNELAVGAVWVFEAGMSIVFCIDVVLNFNTAFQRDGTWIYDRPRIAGRYLLGWFWIDCPSALPLELIELVLHKEQHNLATLRILRMFRLFRLLRLLKVKEYISRIEEAFMINLRVLKLVEIFVKLAFIAHMLGCGWFYMTLFAEEDEPTWLSEYDGGSALNGPFSKQYLYCLYWSLTTMSTVGYGDITPANDRERAFATFSLVVGALSFAFINGNVVGLLSTLDNQASLVEEKLEAVKEYVQWRSLPKDLIIRIRRYYEHYYTRRAVFNETDILDQLNPQLHLEVVNHILEEQLGGLPLFAKLNPNFKIELFPYLKPISFAPGDVIYKKGAPSRTIYFLLSGEIDVYRGLDDRTATNLHSQRSQRARPTSRFTSSHETDLSAIDWTGMAPTSKIGDDGETLLKAATGRPMTRPLPHQGIFGQAALLGRRREATLIARSSCEALLVSKEDLQRLFDGDALSARRVCMLVLDDFLRMDRLSMLALRMRIVSTKEPQDVKAALTLQYHWRRYNDQLARANDPVYDLIENEGKPVGDNAKWVSNQARWMSRSPSRRLRLTKAHALPKPEQTSPTATRPPAAAADSELRDNIGEIKEMLLEMKGRLERLEETTPRTKHMKKGSSSIVPSRGGTEAGATVGNVSA